MKNIFSEKFLDILGWAGSLLILLGYILLLNNQVTPVSSAYLWINLVGSVLLAVNLHARKAQGALFLQACFILVSLYGFWKLLA